MTDPYTGPMFGRTRPQPADDLTTDTADTDDGLDTPPEPLPTWQIHNRDPWDRQFREPDRAFNAWQIYRDMGAARSSAKVAQRLGVSRAMTDRWMSRWRWTERARLWMDHQNRIMVEAQEQATRTAAERHATLARGVMALIARRLAGDTATGTQPIDANTINGHQLARLLKAATEVERAALGLQSPFLRQMQQALTEDLDEAGRRLVDDEMERIRLEVAELLGAGDQPV